MAAIADMSQMGKDNLMCTLALLILQDEKQDITPGSIQKLTEAAGAPVSPLLASLFTRALDGVDVGSIIEAAGSVSAVAAPGPSAAASAPASGAAAVAAEPEKEEPEEEEDMGFSLFD